MLPREIGHSPWPGGPARCILVLGPMLPGPRTDASCVWTDALLLCSALGASSLSILAQQLAVGSCDYLLGADLAGSGACWAVELGCWLAGLPAAIWFRVDSLLKGAEGLIVPSPPSSPFPARSLRSISLWASSMPRMSAMLHGFSGARVGICCRRFHRTRETTSMAVLMFRNIVGKGAV